MTKPPITRLRCSRLPKPVFRPWNIGQKYGGRWYLPKPMACLLDTCELSDKPTLPGKQEVKDMGRLLMEKQLKLPGNWGYQKVYLETMPELQTGTPTYMPISDSASSMGLMGKQRTSWLRQMTAGKYECGVGSSPKPGLAVGSSYLNQLPGKTITTSGESTAGVGGSDQG